MNWSIYPERSETRVDISKRTSQQTSGLKNDMLIKGIDECCCEVCSECWMSQPACLSSSICTGVLWFQSVLEPDSLWRSALAVYCSPTCLLTFHDKRWMHCRKQRVSCLFATKSKALRDDHHRLLCTQKAESLPQRACVRMERFMAHLSPSSGMPAAFDVFFSHVASFEMTAFLLLRYVKQRARWWSVSAAVVCYLKLKSISRVSGIPARIRFVPSEVNKM